MRSKFSKFLSFLGVLSKRPSVINFALDDNAHQKDLFQKKYPSKDILPQVKLNQLSNNIPKQSVTTFLTTGGSMLTDLQLLMTLASRPEVESYLEIGTWHGESVYNVSKIINDCTTLNLSYQEMQSMGLSPKYIEQHGILSRTLPSIVHVDANTKTFNFDSLGKKYDLIFIDGDHSYEMVKNDTEKVFKHLVHDQSIVVWHDYAYHPEKPRYEVYRGILDGIGRENQPYLYHVKGTLCAIFTKQPLDTTTLDEWELPEKVYEVNFEERNFSAQ